MRNRVASFVPLMRAALVMDLELVDDEWHGACIWADCNGDAQGLALVPLYLLARLHDEGVLGLRDPWHLMGAQDEEE